MLPLWYPAGHGSQPLHNLTVTLCRADDTSRCAAAWTSALGLREVELVQDPLPWTSRVNESLGPSRSFYFRVNDVDIFCGGSCWIRTDSFLTNVTPERYRAWIELMVPANQKMIR